MNKFLSCNMTPDAEANAGVFIFLSKRTGLGWSVVKPVTIGVWTRQAPSVPKQPSPGVEY